MNTLIVIILVVFGLWILGVLALSIVIVKHLNKQRKNKWK